MKTDGYTRMGGAANRFPTTCWTVIDAVETGEESRNHLLIGELVRDYWKPVYCYLRHKGYHNEKAKDLTQGFFQEVVLGRKLVQRADQTRGRFRTLLLTALDHYLANVHRNLTAKKRIPAGELVPLDLADGNHLPQFTSELSSEDSFNYAWISTLLDRTLREVEEECGRQGMAIHWHLFRDRVLQPLLEDREPPSMADVCVRYNIEESIKASNMIVSVKRRLQSAIKRQIRQSVASDAEVSEEIHLLTQFFKDR